MTMARSLLQSDKITVKHSKLHHSGNVDFLDVIYGFWGACNEIKSYEL